ncbi:MAG: BMP family ABC transporter substrate-binding protein [Candidatus Riflebacteria bacterium]|nr:BMP family ABC transporter substrate-binding protein [Candidatus Riflebacteria bacterium]
MSGKSTFLKKSILGTGFLIAALLIMTSGCCNQAPKDDLTSSKRIGLMITPRGLNDKGFNDYAYDGLKQAEKKFNIEGVVIEPSTTQDHEASLRFFAGQKFDAIIVVGVGFNDAIRKVATEHPELQFFVIDSEIDEGNIRGVYFREDEGAYLCGYLAARMSKTGKIGFIGGVKIPVIERFANGYRNGALAAVNSTEVVEQFVAEDYSGFNNPEKASEMALDMYRTGCDVIFPAAGASGLGVISAAVKARGQVIGVDMNQDSLAPGLVLTSMLKRVDLVVENIIKNICEGKNPAAIKRSYGISDGVIGLTDFQLSSKVVGDDLISELATVRKAIIDGTIKTGAAGR